MIMTMITILLFSCFNLCTFFNLQTGEDRRTPLWLYAYVKRLTRSKVIEVVPKFKK